MSNLDVGFFNDTNVSYPAKLGAAVLLLGAIPQYNKRGVNKNITVFEYEKGKIIILPYPYDEGCYETEKEWKREAKKYLDALLELNKALISNADTYSLPIWSGNIKILDEEDEENSLHKIWRSFTIWN